MHSLSILGLPVLWALSSLPTGLSRGVSLVLVTQPSSFWSAFLHHKHTPDLVSSCPLPFILFLSPASAKSFPESFAAPISKLIFPNS